MVIKLIDDLRKLEMAFLVAKHFVLAMGLCDVVGSLSDLSDGNFDSDSEIVEFHACSATLDKFFIEFSYSFITVDGWLQTKTEIRTLRLMKSFCLKSK
jgi:hypothetical protein